MSTYNKEQVSGNRALQVCNICKHFVHTSTCFGPPSSVLYCKTKLSDSFSISPSSFEVNPLSSSTADTMSIIWTENNRETLVIQQGHENSMVKILLILIFHKLEQIFLFFVLCTVVKKWQNNILACRWIHPVWHIKQYVSMIFENYPLELSHFLVYIDKTQFNNIFNSTVQ